MAPDDICPGKGYHVASCRLWFGPCPPLISHTPWLQVIPPYPFPTPCQACPQTFPRSTTCPKPPLSVPEFPLFCGPLLGWERDGGSQLQTLTQAAAPLLSMSWTPKPQLGPEVPMPSEMRPLRPVLTLSHVDPQGCPDRNPQTQSYIYRRKVSV